MMDRSEQGIALIVVIWALVLLSIIAANISVDASTSTRIARNIDESAVAQAAADAGIQRAILDLETSTTTAGAAGFRSDGTVYAWRFSNSTVLISIKDEASKIDLNKAPEALFAALFESIGVDPDQAESLADAIADFRDADDLKHLKGAEKAEYRAAGLEWDPKNAPFQTIEELQQVLGMTAEIYDRVAPDLSVFALTSTLPATDDERLMRIISQAGFEPPPVATSPRSIFRIRAEAKTDNGGVFTRQAIVQLSAGEATAQSGPLILSWDKEWSHNSEMKTSVAR
jgi:general secretion pathway protein K